MSNTIRELAIITGASSGIGLELAKCCAQKGYDIIIAANEPEIYQAAEKLGVYGVNVQALEADLATVQGVKKLYNATQGKKVEAFLANAGRGLGKAFVDQDFKDWSNVIDTNITGTICLLQMIARDMASNKHGRILITGSIAGFMPGSYQAVYNGTKAFLDSFSFALRHELKDLGVTVTCLMPGATETEFFERADMMDTKVGVEKKMDAAEVAKLGFEAMLNNQGQVIAGWQNKLQAAIASVTPSEMLADMHAKMAKPGTARKAS